MTGEASKAAEEKGERLAKVIAHAGLCSRREAEVLIVEGKVTLEGRKVTEPGTVVLPGQSVTVNGQPLPAPPAPRLWRFHKPDGVLTAAADPHGRRTIYDLFPLGLPRVMPVGRLDLNSEGLLLLTNDGGLKRRLELPASGWKRRYRVRVWGDVEPAKLAELAEGVTVEGVDYGPIEARLDRQSGANAWLTMTLREGKNREIRKVCQHIGYRVNRLIRVSYGPFHLGQLAEGAIEEVPRHVMEAQLGEGTPERRERKGHAKPKPKPVKPGHRKAAALKRARKAGHVGPAADEKAGIGRRKTERKPAAKDPKRPAGKPAGKPDANRRRPS